MVIFHSYVNVYQRVVDEIYKPTNITVGLHIALVKLQ